MAKPLTESDVLKKLDIPDFRHLTKDKVMQFASMLNEMDPAVAMEAIKQFPDFAKLTLESLKDYKGVIEKALDSGKESTKQCYEIYNQIIAALSVCVEKDDISFEEKQYYIEKMMQIAQMAEAKDSEGKELLWKIVAAASTVASIAIGISAAVLSGGKLDINLPHK